MHRLRLCLAAAWLLAWNGRAAPALAVALPVPGMADAALCQVAIDAAERRSPLPRRLLSAIALVESGRPLGGGKVVAWPWTINVGGIGTFYDSADAAIAAVAALQAAGVRSIDVGCMQVNLLHHPDAFASLRDAFDPALNAAYAARFLGQLHAEMGEWPKAVAAYHSRTPDLAADYERRVVRTWPDAAAYGVAAMAGPGGTPAPGKPPGLETPEFAARLRQAAADHAMLTRMVVGAGPGRSPLLSAGSRLRLPGLRVAQAGDGRGAAIRR